MSDANALLSRTRASQKPDFEEAWIAGIAQGSRDDFSALYESCYPAIYAYVLSILRNRADADDAAQETFLHIRSAAHLYQPQGKPMAWMLTIAKNVCMMQFRRQSRESSYSADEIPISDDLCVVDDRDDRIALEAALKQLSAEECRIVLLHAVSGLKHREIAALLELPLATVLSKYHRSLQKLRRNLEDVS